MDTERDLAAETRRLLAENPKVGPQSPQRRLAAALARLERMIEDLTPRGASPNGHARALSNGRAPGTTLKTGRSCSGR